MRVFITGGTGVLGRWVVRLLVESGEQVRALSRSEKNTATLRTLGAEPVEANLFHTESLCRALKDCSAILHLATKIPSLGRFRSPSAWETNDRIRREGTRNLVNAALELQAQTFIYPSVCFVYPDSGDGWIDCENVNPLAHPITLSTMEAEEQVARFGACGGRGVSLRMGAFYGPESEQSQQQLKMARRGFAALFGAGQTYHSVIWISDAARAVVAAARHAPSGIYDVVDNEPLENGETLVEIAKAVNRRNVRRIPSWALQWMVGASTLKLLARSQRVSNRRFKEATGWFPKVSNARVGWPMVALSRARLPLGQQENESKR